jgi:hypothetical protein
LSSSNHRSNLVRLLRPSSLLNTDYDQLIPWTPISICSQEVIEIELPNPFAFSVPTSRPYQVSDPFLSSIVATHTFPLVFPEIHVHHRSTNSLGEIDSFEFSRIIDLSAHRPYRARFTPPNGFMDRENAKHCSSSLQVAIAKDFEYCSNKGNLVPDVVI